MAQNYTRQSTFSDGDTITAALFNDEYNQLENAFNYSSSSSTSTGHRHDGTAGQGGNIPQIGDLDFLNKIVVDSTNNRWGFFVEVSSAAVEQIRIQDGAIVPVTDNDIDLGTSSLEFKDLYLDGTATIDTLTVDGAATVGTTLGVIGATTLSSTLGVTGATTLSSTLGVTGAATLSSTLAVTGTSTLTGNVTATNDLSVGGNLTVTGNATISGNLTFGDADTDSITLTADVASHITPDVDDTYDLGSSTKEWRNLYIDGTANIDSLVADTADINAGTIDNTTIGATTASTGNFSTLSIGGTAITSTATELNIVDGDTTATSTTLADADRVVVNDAGTMVQVALTDFETYFESALDTLPNVTTVGALNAGSITSGFGAIDNGSSAITTTGTVTYGSLSDGTITITAFVDEDDMVSNSATLVPTQQSVKAYVDSQVTAQDLDFQGDSGGALSIDLDSETLTIAGGTGIDTTGATNTLTVAIDSTVATLTGTQTLTNKTLTTPVIATISNTGTLTLPTSTDTLVGRATTDTLTNKTLTSAVLNTSVSGTAVLDEDDMASDSATQLITQQSAKAYIDATATALAIALG
jgi:fibronectin-binding autotransporter adhesin